MTTRDDSIKWQPFAKVEKYSPDQVKYATEFLGHEPTGLELQRMFTSPEDGTAEVSGNLLTTAGLQRITNLIIASGAQGMTSTRTAVGVGDSSTAATVGDTALIANGANAYYNTVDSAPTAVNGVLTCVSTFGTSVGNFAWNEWCWVITNGAITPGNTLASIGTTPQILNRKVASLGTKASGASWVFTTTVTLS